MTAAAAAAADADPDANDDVGRGANKDEPECQSD